MTAEPVRIRPHLLKGNERKQVDDQRILNGIIFVQRNGLRWRDAPKEPGPPKVLYNGWKRWSDRGSFPRMMAT